MSWNKKKKQARQKLIDGLVASRAKNTKETCSRKKNKYEITMKAGKPVTVTAHEFSMGLEGMAVNFWDNVEEVTTAVYTEHTGLTGGSEVGRKCVACINVSDFSVILVT